MRRLRTYIERHDNSTSFRYYICSVLTCRDGRDAFLIEPHFFSDIYSPSTRQVHEENYRIEYYTVLPGCIHTSKGIFVSIENDHLVVEFGCDKYYITEPLYDL